MEKKFYDENSFYIKKSDWGTYKSFTKDDKPLITSLTEDDCIFSSRAYLKWTQEGFPESKSYYGKVDGKL